MQKILKRFRQTPLYARGETRQDPLLIVYDKEDRIFKRNTDLHEVGTRFQDLLKVIPSRRSFSFDHSCSSIINGYSKQIRILMCGKRMWIMLMN